MPRPPKDERALKEGDVGEALDRDSDRPAYAQLAGMLRDKIARGDYRPGTKIPSVPELTATFGVASMTVRQAIDLLSKEGAVVRERGRGTFVKPPELASAMFGLDDLKRQLTDDRVSVRVLGARSVRARGRVAIRLDVAESTRVISIRRLLLRDEAPIFYHSEYLVWDPRRPLVEAELGITALRGLFSGAGERDVKNGDLTLHASALTEAEAGCLDEDPGAIAWVVEHLFYDFDDRPLSWGRFVCRADRMEFRTSVGIIDGRRQAPDQRS